MNKWQEKSLADIAIINPRESIKKGQVAKKVGMDVLQPFTKKISSYSLEPFNGGTKFRNGDTLVARITPCLENGKTAFVDILDDNEVGYGSTEYIVLREKENESDKHFLYYLAMSPGFRDIAILSMTGSSGRQRVQTEVVTSYLFEIPPIIEQKAITAVLASLDDKIDLLHRQNKTLEALAQTLFRHWFIDGAEDDWEECQVRDFAKHQKQNVKPGAHASEIFIHYSLPAFDDGKKPVRELGGEIRSNKYAVMPFSILVSKLNPRFPRIWDINFQPEPNSICSTEFQVLTPKSKEEYGFVSYLLKSEEAKAELQMAASGTSGSHQRVKPDDILNISFSIQNREAVKRFSHIVEPNLAKIRSNQRQIQTLEKLRDTLLPKLMSGEVRVKN